MTLLPILIPVELFKCKAQSAQGGVYSYRKDFSQVYGREGIRGMYRGTASTFLREVPGSGILFAVKDALETKLNVHNEQNYFLLMGKKVFSGGVAGLCAWCFTIPIDSIKSVIQTSAEKRRIGEVAVSMYKSQGLTPFFRGIVPQAFRIFPASSSLLVVYELMKNFLN